MKPVVVAIAAALVIPVSSKAQAPVAGGEGPAERLLAHRAELALSAAQVQKLEAIERKYDQQDKEVVARLEAVRGKPVGQPLRLRDLPAAEREQLFAKRAELQPLMQQLRTSHQAAIAEVKGVLNAEQNGKANAYLYQGPGQGQGRGPMAGVRGQGPGRNAGPGMRGAGFGAGSGRAGMRGQGRMGGRGQGMMLHAPGTGQGFGGGRGRWGAR